MSYHVRVTREQQTFNIEEFRRQVERFWLQALVSPNIQAALEKSEPQPVHAADATDGPVIQVKPTSQGFAGVDTVVISVVGGVLTNYTVRALDYMWQEHVWPSLKAQYRDRISSTHNQLNPTESRKG